MMAQCVVDGHSTRTVVSDAEAATLRQALCRSAQTRRLTIRTARLGAKVAVVRTDSAIWHETAAVMRAKLTP